MLKVANSVINASRITGVLPVANGGTNASTASITSFNNITGFTASGTTGTTSTKLVFDTTPTLVGDVTLSTGNLIPGTAAKGVNFTANTSLAGMTSRLLNKYEEGTFTPFISFGGGVVGITYNQQTGIYTRVGRAVTASGHIYLNTKGSSTGVFELKGLPYTSNGYAVVSITYRSNITYTGQLQAYLNTSEARVTISTISTAGVETNLTDTAVGTNIQFYFSCTYHGQ